MTLFLREERWSEPESGLAVAWRTFLADKKIEEGNIWGDLTTSISWILDNLTHNKKLERF